MKIRDPWTGTGLICYRCRRTPDQLPEYVNNPDGLDAHTYVWENEGTLNRSTGHFACTRCYISAGMPTAPWPGWKAP